MAVIREVYEEYGFTWDGESYMADIQDVELYYFGLGGRFWVWEDEAGVQGTIGLEVFDRVPGSVGTAEIVDERVRICGADCSLERLYVRPSARQKGIGGALTQVCLDGARAMGRSAMEIWSDKHFVDAHRLYERFGAVVVGDRICHDPDLSPEWGMVIRLNA